MSRADIRNIIHSPRDCGHTQWNLVTEGMGMLPDVSIWKAHASGELPWTLHLEGEDPECSHRHWFKGLEPLPATPADSRHFPGVSAHHRDCRFFSNSENLLSPPTSEVNVEVLPRAVCKYAGHTPGRICVHVFHCKGGFIGFMKSSPHPGDSFTGWRLFVEVFWHFKLVVPTARELHRCPVCLR